MLDRFENIALVDYNGQYEAPLEGTSMKYVYKINTSELKKDLIEKLTK